jgi:hypothetical protein
MQRRVLTLAFASAVLSLLVSTVGTPAIPSPESLAAPTCNTAQLSDVMDVYLGVPTPKVTPMPIPAGVSSYLSKVLQSRLAACQSSIDPADGRPCEPSGSESYDPRLLWTHLRFCELLVKPPVPTPSGIPWQLPGLGQSQFQPVIFVMGAGGASPTLSKLISTLTVYLNDGNESAGYHFVHDAILIPEPDWTTDYYAGQCQSSPNVEGAIIVNITATGNGASDEFISRRNWAAVEATATYAQCSHGPTAMSRGVPSVVWASNIAQEEDHHSTFTPLLPLSLLLTLGAIYEEFVPQRATQVTSKHIFASPKPVPSSGFQSEVDTATTTTLNAAQVGSVASGFLSSSISYTNSSAPLTQQPAVDQQTWNALQSIAIKLIADMNCWQSEPEPIGSRSASDVVGASRRLPSYSPPAGLGAYRSGRPSAPFCSESGVPESVRMVMPPAANPAK